MYVDYQPLYVIVFSAQLLLPAIHSVGSIVFFFSLLFCKSVLFSKW